MAYVTKAQGPAGKTADALVCDSFEDFADWLAQTNGRRSHGRFSLSRVTRRLTMGDDAAAQAAERLLSKIEAETAYGEGMAMGRAVAGAVPDVAAFLAGSPLAMRRRVPRETVAPLTIVVESFLSGTVETPARLRRAAAILALLRRLAMVGHAVDLWVAHTTSPRGGPTGTCVVKVNTKPLDLARAAYALTAGVEGDNGYKLATMTAVMRVTDESEGSFPMAFGIDNWPNKPESLPPYYGPLLGVDPGVLLGIPGLRGEQHPFTNDDKAIAWVNHNYAKALDLVRGNL